MKTVLIMRHAKSSWKKADVEDHDRPLNKRGKRDAARMGALLREQALTPDLILSSTAKRARKTAEAVAEKSGCKEEAKFLRALYPGGPEEFLRVLRGLPASYERVLVIGHNPGVEEFLDMLTGEGNAMPTAAIAQVKLPIENWTDLGPETEGDLINSWSPKELD